MEFSDSGCQWQPMLFRLLILHGFHLGGHDCAGRHRVLPVDQAGVAPGCGLNVVLEILGLAAEAAHAGAGRAIRRLDQPVVLADQDGLGNFLNGYILRLLYHLAHSTSDLVSRLRNYITCLS